MATGCHELAGVLGEGQELITVPAPITLPVALKLVKKFECFGFSFPKTTEGITALAEKFMQITGDADKANWLCERVLNGCSRCPTPIELRRIFALKYPPADGIGANDCDLADFMAGGKEPTSR